MQLEVEQQDITIDDLNGLLTTLDAYQRILEHAVKSWALLTEKEKQCAVDAFDQIEEISKGFE